MPGRESPQHRMPASTELHYDLALCVTRMQRVSETHSVTGRLQSLRTVHKISGYRPSDKNGEWLTMSDAAARLGVSHIKIRRFIRDGILPADRVMRCAPYQIRSSDLEDERIKAELARKIPCRYAEASFRGTVTRQTSRIAARDRRSVQRRPS